MRGPSVGAADVDADVDAGADVVVADANDDSSVSIS